MAETWIILGATSSMARAFVRAVVGKGDGVVLAGRDMDDLEASAVDARLRGAPVAEAMRFDAREPESFEPILDRARADRKSTRLNSSHSGESRMPSSA